ncbi:tRNA (adenosine(37)-N6)-dimethylallyltransferase MiaA [Candidatus Saccharibacteria bacterium]|nr:MAG: tRNA (adenosine(37)-N6)-dimethylallyltransferase MiaA [Candidatus Saccharibacteria bacterium]
MATVREAPLVVIVGPTASGKTGLAIKLAKHWGGEIISADSRSIYRGMDIGTAKPSLVEQEGVVHFGLDLADPDQRFTAADFKKYAEAKIVDIRNREKVPILVGGTGLYIDGVIFDYSFDNSFNPELRATLQNLSAEELVEYCNQHSIELPQNRGNKRHLIRAIEIGGINHKRNSSLIDNCFVVGISPSRVELRERARQRAHIMFSAGVVEETIKLTQQFDWSLPSMSGSIYPIINRLLLGEISEAEVIELAVQSDMRLAKRQITWFRRNKAILWSESAEKGYLLASKALQAYKAEH